MHMTRAHSRICGIAAALLTAAVPVFAQSTAPQTPSATAQQKPAEPSPARTSGESETRPATTTFEGDTGLWFVPTGEVLPAKKWSLSAYRVNFDRDQGFTDVSNWPVTAGIGLADRAEIFGAFTRRAPDRPRRPAGVRGDAAAGRRPGQRVSVRAARVVRQPAGRLHDWREGQPVVRVAAGAGGAGGAGAAEAADGEGRRRRGRHREDGLQFRRDPEQGAQPAGGALRLCRLHHARRPVGRRSEQWVPLGHRRRAAVARAAAADGGTPRRAATRTTP